MRSLSLLRPASALTVLACLALAPAAHAQFQAGDILVNEYSSSSSSSVQQYRPNGTLVRTFTGTGNQYEGASLTPSGSLVTTFRSPRSGINIFDATGTQTNTFAIPTNITPGDVSVFADGTLAVSGQENNSVFYYSQSGTLLNTA